MGYFRGKNKVPTMRTFCLARPEFWRVLLTLALILIGLRTSAEAFNFIALGDTAYNGERDYPVYNALIDLINQEQPAFSIHVGDIWGAGSCSDTHLEEIKTFFDRYQQPLVYTPGDNEWTDCHRPSLGEFDPLERLAKLREVFFSTPSSLGKHPMQLVRQSDISKFKFIPENARWERSRVLFVTASVPGSHNGANPHSEASLREFYARNKANVSWINDSFRIAIEGNYKALVLSVHAEMFESEPYRLGVFGDTIAALREGGDHFGRPVLLINGDYHKLLIDRPLLEEHGEDTPSRYTNITRLRVNGAPEIRAVKVIVQPDTPWVFGFQPLYNE